MILSKSELKIKVMGLGGAGVGTVNYISEIKNEQLEFIAIDTNLRKMSINENVKNVIIGEQLTMGLGTGGNFELGEKAIVENMEEIEELLKGTDLLFLTAGMGGGVGSSTISVISKIAEKMGILTIGVITTPFTFEGKARRDNSNKGIKNLKESIDTFIIISNDKLLELPDKEISFKNAFLETDNILKKAIKGIINLILKDGFVNLDFEDVKTITKKSGIGIIGVGEGNGESRVKIATKLALHNILFDMDLTNAKKLLVNITASNSLTLNEAQKTSDFIKEEIGNPETLIWGITVDEKLGDSVEVIIIATAFENKF